MSMLGDTLQDLETLLLSHVKHSREQDFFSIRFLHSTDLSVPDLLKQNSNVFTDTFFKTLLYDCCTTGVWGTCWKVLCVQWSVFQHWSWDVIQISVTVLLWILDMYMTFISFCIIHTAQQTCWSSWVTPLTSSGHVRNNWFFLQSTV